SNVNQELEAGGIFTDGKHIVFAPSPLPVNTWTHLALTFDGAMIRLYVNGTIVASAPVTASLTTSIHPLFIGADSTMGQYFNGIIDEVRVYTVALTAAQIQTDMNTPVGMAAREFATSLDHTASGSHGFWMSDERDHFLRLLLRLVNRAIHP